MKPCSVDDCENPSKSRGWCDAHYKRWWRHGDPLAGGTPRRADRLCSVIGCSAPHFAGDYCRSHYSRWRLHGDPLAVVHLHASIEERLRFYASTDDPAVCWIWTGRLTPQGYGTMTADRSTRLVHRVAYELWVGPIPARLEIDHLCRVRHCINPRHLEPVTHAENIRRAHAVPGVA